MAGRREGASHSRASWGDRYESWLRHHSLSAADSLRRLRERTAASLLTWLVIGIALALPVGLSVALDNVRLLSAGWDDPARISLFLAIDVSEDDARQLQLKLAARDDVAALRFVSRADALQEFSEMSGFADVLESLEQNPLPHLLIVSPVPAADPVDAVAALAAELEALPAVQQAVLDMQWVQRLNSLMQLGQRLVLALGSLLVLGVLLVLGNTIRLAIENRREEIVVVKLVGGSDAFVRRPFLYTGLWYGLGGGLVAWLAVTAALWLLEQPVETLAMLYQNQFHLQGLGLLRGLELTLMGGGLGLGGAWLAVARHLRDIEPR
jgi:cell division transport system permease protein